MRNDQVAIASPTFTEVNGPPADYADRNPALARSLSDAELDAVDDRGFELALDLLPRRADRSRTIANVDIVGQLRRPDDLAVYAWPALTLGPVAAGLIS